MHRFKTVGPAFRAGLGLAYAMLVSDAAQGKQPPLPPEKPAALRASPPIVQPAPSRAATKGAIGPKFPPSEGMCLAGLQRSGIDVIAAVQPAAGRSDCRIDEPVRLRSLLVAARKGIRIVFADQPLLSCEFATVYTHWIAEAVAPLIAGRMVSDIRSIRTGPGYECRNRNRAVSGKLSAHALGRAIDMDQIELADGRKLLVGNANPADHIAAFNALRKSGCGWFTTVLGPGSDAAHATHVHVDIERHGRSNRYRICD